MKKTKIKTSLKLYLLLVALAAVGMVLHEADVLPTAYIPSNARTDYVLNLIAIVTSLGSVFFAHRVLNTSSVKSKITQADEAKALAVYVRCARYRYIVQAIGLLVNLWIYYATICLSTPMYGSMIAAISYLFCKPSLHEFEKMRHPDDALPPRREGLSL